MVTNHDAQEYPKIVIEQEDGHRRALQFDRILCDVPCSGDGTMRKNKTIWKTWKTSFGLGLHRLQRNILLRGLELLKVDGLLVYSTCSFNPIENEAVVASVLQETDGCFELVDVSNQIKSLKRYPGVSEWKVQTSDGTWSTSYSDKIPGLQKTMFPPANIEKFGMEKW